jgi:diacylglycerol kinase family enzyme
MTIRLILVINPTSGGGRCGSLWWPILANRLHQAGFAFIAVFTRRRGDATRIAQRALRDGAETVVAVGGDGTVCEVLNGFFHEGQLINPAARLAFIGAGTGNDMLYLHKDNAAHPTAARNPCAAHRHTDILRVRYTDVHGQTQTRYALLHVALGLLAETEGCPIPLLIRRIGPRVYLWAGALAAVRQRPLRAVYRFDGNRSWQDESLGGVIANAPTFGGGIPVAPGASPDDGVADVILLRRVDRARLLGQLMPRLQQGTHVTHPAIARHEAREIAIEGPAVALAIDGDFVGRTPAVITVLPGVLPLASPPCSGQV